MSLVYKKCLANRSLITFLKPDTSATENWKIQTLPLARVKKIMKSEEFIMQELEKERLQKEAAESGNTDLVSERTGVKFMISGEAPILMSKACELLIKDLTFRAWQHTERNRRRTLQRQDLHAAVGESEVYDFLIDIVPRIQSIPTGPAPPAAAAPAPAPMNQPDLSQMAMGAAAGTIPPGLQVHQMGMSMNPSMMQQQAMGGVSTVPHMVTQQTGAPMQGGGMDNSNNPQGGGLMQFQADALHHLSWDSTQIPGFPTMQTPDGSDGQAHAAGMPGMQQQHGDQQHLQQHHHNPQQWVNPTNPMSSMGNAPQHHQQQQQQQQQQQHQHASGL